MSNATRILIALVVGLSLGILRSRAVARSWGEEIAYWLDIVGSLWLNGLRMTVVPLVVALLITGIVKSAEAARAGPMAARTVTWIVINDGSSLRPWVHCLRRLLLSLFPMPEESAAAIARGADHCASRCRPTGVARFYRCAGADESDCGGGRTIRSCRF